MAEIIDLAPHRRARTRQAFAAIYGSDDARLVRIDAALADAEEQLVLARHRARCAPEHERAWREADALALARGIVELERIRLRLAGPELALILGGAAREPRS
ncbi:MAG TPA: hypothetical protein VFQ35_10890 [Polyangiaceae bacterium]|nr:hypothetical protein [Polyangiaceae bacterium]